MHPGKAGVDHGSEGLTTSRRLLPGDVTVMMMTHTVDDVDARDLLMEVSKS